MFPTFNGTDFVQRWLKRGKMRGHLAQFMFLIFQSIKWSNHYLKDLLGIFKGKDTLENLGGNILVLSSSGLTTRQDRYLRALFTRRKVSERARGMGRGEGGEWLSLPWTRSMWHNWWPCDLLHEKRGMQATALFACPFTQKPLTAVVMNRILASPSYTINLCLS